MTTYVITYFAFPTWLTVLVIILECTAFVLLLPLRTVSPETYRILSAKHEVQNVLLIRGDVDGWNLHALLHT
jgi:hypothetical protein